MIQSLRKRLIIIYTITAGTILTAVFLVVALFFEYQSTRNQYEAFSDHSYTLMSKLKTENIISDTWLSDLERKYQLVISIYDNGSILLFSGAWEPKTPRDFLLEQVQHAATQDGISLFSRPVSSDTIQTDIYTITGEHSETYYGSAIILKNNYGYRTLFLLMPTNSNSPQRIYSRLLFVSFDLLGILALFVLIRKLVDRSLQPVKKNQQRQTEFVAAASHELRSPLAVIRANNSTIKLTPEEQLNCEAVIESECNRMSRLINDMLLLASNDANTWAIQKNEVNIETLMLQSYENLSPIARQKQIKILLDLPQANLPTLIGDYDRLLQIISILLDNAISYSSANSQIIIKAELEKKHLLLHIIDHGIGIPDEAKPYVFDRFYRVDSSRNNKTHFGLGLSIAKELVTLHHGTITLTDTISGGCTFTLRFPC
jgi:signal transduction histidine kinase